MKFFEGTIIQTGERFFKNIEQLTAKDFKEKNKKVQTEGNSKTNEIKLGKNTKFEKKLILSGCKKMKTKEKINEMTLVFVKEDHDKKALVLGFQVQNTLVGLIYVILIDNMSILFSKSYFY